MMKKQILFVVFILAFTTAFARNKGDKHNYKYEFKASCNCIISKDNPAGIEEVSIFPYETDPDIHEHNAGYYAKNSKEIVTQFSLTDFSPKDFGCQPCFSFITDKKYVFVFKGKPDKDEVSVKLYKDSKGEIHAIK